jgi:hypothetical protein
VELGNRVVRRFPERVLVGADDVRFSFDRHVSFRFC